MPTTTTIRLNELKTEIDKLQRRLQGPIIPGAQIGIMWYKGLCENLERIISIYLAGKIGDPGNGEYPAEGKPVLAWDGKYWSVQCWWPSSARWVPQVEYDFGLLGEEIKAWVPLPEGNKVKV